MLTNLLDPPSLFTPTPIHPYPTLPYLPINFTTQYLQDSLHLRFAYTSSCISSPPCSPLQATCPPCTPSPGSQLEHCMSSHEESQVSLYSCVIFIYIVQLQCLNSTSINFCVVATTPFQDLLFPPAWSRGPLQFKHYSWRE